MDRLSCDYLARSPSMESPDKIVGSSPRVNCSFLFARQPPPTADKARCIKWVVLSPVYLLYTEL